jgi:predicted nucleic acid-binding protein
MSRFCLDTSAYSHYRRGDPAVVELIDAAEWIGVPAIVIGELRTTFRLGARPSQNEAELREFLECPVVEELPVEGEVSRHFAHIVVELRRDGTPLPTNDLWIAATAARHGALVLTYNRHFEQISRVGTIVLEKEGAQMGPASDEPRTHV